MICNLHIENIAVIQRADVDFARGFCVLTGETGAGKSILIDSINAILGERTAKDLIRAGCSTATVVAEFENVSKECEDILKTFDVTCEDGTVIISRTITKQKSSAKINGVPVTNSALKSVAPYLVNIHGQHDSQQLLNPDKHFIYIDLLAKNEQLKNEYKSAFSLMQKTRKQVLSFNENVEKREKQIALLEHAVDELSKADLQSGEMEKLQSRREQLLKNKDAAKMLNSALAALDGEQGILSAVDEIAEHLISKNNIHNDIMSAANEISNARDYLENTRSLIKNALYDCDFDEKELSQIDDRLDIYYAFQGKYGKTDDEMIAYFENAKNELETLKNSVLSAEQLTVELAEQVENVKKLGASLTQSRKTAAEKFERDVEEQLKFLDMPNVKIKVDVQKSSYSSNGADKIEFLISTNKGEQLKPLSKIASGGEMSRIMLSIKCVLSEDDPVGTMIFDEIDAGISGQAALKVGNRLKSVAKNRQVICVTHLAQIACMADCHLQIKKTTDSDRTYTEITPLDNDGRKNELARIIGGNVTQSALKTAEELLNAYNQSK